MSGIEIERKFLVHKDGRPYRTQAYASSRITQGYICSERGRTVRVRIRDGRGYLTIKGPSDPTGTTRYEFEKEITPDEAQQATLLKMIEKMEELDDVQNIYHNAVITIGDDDED